LPTATTDGGPPRPNPTSPEKKRKQQQPKKNDLGWSADDGRIFVREVAKWETAMRRAEEKEEEEEEEEEKRNARVATALVARKEDLLMPPGLTNRSDRPTLPYT
jgi:hypothetical protein